MEKNDLIKAFNPKRPVFELQLEDDQTCFCHLDLNQSKTEFMLVKAALIFDEDFSLRAEVIEN